jgi:hypothetical protein
MFNYCIFSAIQAKNLISTFQIIFFLRLFVIVGIKKFPKIFAQNGGAIFVERRSTIEGFYKNGHNNLDCLIKHTKYFLCCKTI